MRKHEFFISWQQIRLAVTIEIWFNEKCRNDCVIFIFSFTNNTVKTKRYKYFSKKKNRRKKKLWLKCVFASTLFFLFLFSLFLLLLLKIDQSIQNRNYYSRFNEHWTTIRTFQWAFRLQFHDRFALIFVCVIHWFAEKFSWKIIIFTLRIIQNIRNIVIAWFIISVFPIQENVEKNFYTLATITQLQLINNYTFLFPTQ